MYICRLDESRKKEVDYFNMDLNDQKIKLDKVLDHLKVELSSIRTGRATPALIENLKVTAYEGSEPLPLVQLASITVPENRQLMVEPWDKSTLAAIEKAITASDLGLAVANEGAHLRLTMPLMTEEVRQQIIKLLNEKLEDCRINLRQQRDKIKEEIIKQEKANQLSEDDRYRLIEDLDKQIKDYNNKIKELGDKKQAEISI